jgi:DNA-directed RNA polymerase III subunit RPC7
MSRTGRGGRGGFGGRSSLVANNPPPMGLTFADIQAMSREQSALYPVRPPPLLSTFILTALRNAFRSLSSLFPH